MAKRNNRSSAKSGGSRNSKGAGAKLLAGLLALVFIGTAVACGIGWGKVTKLEEQIKQLTSADSDKVLDNENNDLGNVKIDVDGGMKLSEPDSNGGVSLLSARIPVTAYAANGISEQADSAYTISITTTPAIVTDVFEWTISDNSAVTMTPGDNDRSVTVVCNNPFSTAITVTVSSVTNPSLTASCQLDYLKRISNLSLDMPTIKLNDTLTEYTVKPAYTLSAGTITPEISFTSGTIVCLSVLYNNAHPTWSGMEANTHGTVDITNGKFSLIMSQTQKSSFYQRVKGADCAGIYEAYFSNFVTYSNASNPDYEINVGYTISAEGQGTYESGTLTGRGNFDVSSLVKPATNINISVPSIIF